MLTISTTSKESDKKSVNHQKKEAPACPYCGSTNVYGISRIVGYFSVIDNWNASKKAELKNRQKGNYWPSKNADIQEKND
ncbi:MAG: anaerobic ribonucleoside-triphosphate reductase [Asgard group archaeon]|nr:anaerobic ribonucleoside-triphosphate reductase [Asgard group archaeon]